MTSFLQPPLASSFTGLLFFFYFFFPSPSPSIIDPKAMAEFFDIGAIAPPLLILFPGTCCLGLGVAFPPFFFFFHTLKMWQRFNGPLRAHTPEGFRTNTLSGWFFPFFFCWLDFLPFRFTGLPPLFDSSGCLKSYSSPLVGVLLRYWNPESFSPHAWFSLTR